MRKILFLLSIYVSINEMYSQQIQLPDSIKNSLNKDTTVIRYEYEEQFHKNGEKESEGWNFISYYNPRTNGQRLNYLVKHRIGLWKFYRKNGTLKSEEFLPHQDTDELTIKNYDKKGNLKMKRIIIPSENKIANSSLGKGNYKGVIMLNKLSATWYFKNGQVERSYSQIGLRNIDDYMIFYKNGQLREKKHYNKNFKLDGKYSYWSEKGQLIIEGQYKNGKKNGIWKWYNDEGVLKKEKTFYNNG